MRMRTGVRSSVCGWRSRVRAAAAGGARRALRRSSRGLVGRQCGYKASSTPFCICVGAELTIGETVVVLVEGSGRVALRLKAGDEDGGCLWRMRCEGEELRVKIKGLLE